MTAVTNVEFFFDPSCPWTWVTSRWLATVAPERQLEVTWRPWSLAIKNQGRDLPATLPPEVRARIEKAMALSARALRVLEAAGEEHGNEARGRLYTEMGRRLHGEGGDTAQHSTDDVVAHALAGAGLPAELAGAADDETWDDAIRANMADVAPAIGDEVGVPIVAVRQGGDLRALSGPIMAEVPADDRALALWDAVATVVTEPSVFEMKRHRTGPPSPPTLDASGGAARGSVA